jgi:hypothetical protein
LPSKIPELAPSARGNSWGWLEDWSSGRYEDEGAAEVIFIEVSLKIGGRVMAWFFMLIPVPRQNAIGG